MAGFSLLRQALGEAPAATPPPALPVPPAPVATPHPGGFALLPAVQAAALASR
jgi:hypothetical protein